MSHSLVKDAAAARRLKAPPQAADAGEKVDEGETGRRIFVFEIVRRKHVAQTVEHNLARFRPHRFKPVNLPLVIAKAFRHLRNRKAGTLPERGKFGHWMPPPSRSISDILSDYVPKNKSGTYARPGNGHHRAPPVRRGPVIQSGVGISCSHQPFIRWLRPEVPALPRHLFVKRIASPACGEHPAIALGPAPAPWCAA